MTFPRYVTYRERLTPDAPPVEVELPTCKEDALDLLAQLSRLISTDPAAWKSLYRQYAICDWYVLAFMLSGTQRLDPFTGRPEWYNDFHFTWARECQFDGDNTIDKSAREHGKAVDVDEAVPTPDGYKKHGDLVVGDTVFGADGVPCKVVSVTRRWDNEECFRVRFDDGYFVTVGASHLWFVELRGHHEREAAVVSTKELSEMSLRTDRRPAVPVGGALQLPDAVLAVPPYVLGAWLGDGTTSNGAITGIDDFIFNKVESLGFELSPVRKMVRTIYGLQTKLRGIGVLGNKHIPQDYQRASEQQRWELLRGLMDTDGYVNPRGTAYLGLKHERLSFDAMELAVGLGLKPTMTVQEKSHGLVYCVTFQAYAGPVCPFSLPRKVARCKTTVRSGRSKRRFIVSVEPVPSVPISCIQVDRDDGLYLIGRHMVPTHNSSLRCYVGITAEVLANPDLSVGIFSFEKAAAEKSGRRLKDEWTNNLELKAAFDDVLWEDPAKDAPLWSMEKGLTVRRAISSASPTVGWYSILDLPTGSRLGLGILDDIETERTVSSEDMRKQTRDRVNNCFNLAGRGCRWWVNGTHHSPVGIISELEKSGGWKVRCHAAEDVSLPAPDIAALYDESGGVLPIREDQGRPIPLPPEVRNVRLAGAPIYLHPLELALKRLRMGNATYSCLPAEAPVLMSDFSERPISELTAGDKIIGFERSVGKGVGFYKLVESVVENIVVKDGELYSYFLEDGSVVTCTENHRWLTGRVEENAKRREYAPLMSLGVKDLKSLLRVLPSGAAAFDVAPTKLRYANWLAGIYDGEGSCSNGTALSISQTAHNADVVQAIAEATHELGFDFGVQTVDKSKAKQSTLFMFYLRGGWKELVRFVRQVSPIKKDRIIKHALKFSHLGRSSQVRAVRREQLGVAPTYSLQTSTGNYVAYGFASSNSHNMGDPLAGQEKRLDDAWVRWYASPPVEWARGSNLYIVIDPSKGVGDPTFARVEACKEDGTINWVGGLRRRLTPSQFAPAIFQLAMEWLAIGRLVEIRVEEFAQSTWVHNLRTYFDSRNQYVCRIVSCSRHNTNNKESAGRQREWSGLEPLYRTGKRVYPRDGIWVEDETGDVYNLVRYYLDKEYGQFPLPETDDGLAADFLLAVTKGKDETGRLIDLALEFPEDDELVYRREAREAREQRRDDDGRSWLSDWAM